MRLRNSLNKYWTGWRSKDKWYKNYEISRVVAQKIFQNYAIKFKYDLVSELPAELTDQSHARWAERRTFRHQFDKPMGSQQKVAHFDAVYIGVLFWTLKWKNETQQQLMRLIIMKTLWDVLELTFPINKIGWILVKLCR